ncbi:hypothetical protein J6590_061309 [Homalodisca vitripennis]|nr:hypothetical protein J6590_061309 [Homalodisca vitripennis]
MNTKSTQTSHSAKRTFISVKDANITQGTARLQGVLVGISRPQNVTVDTAGLECVTIGTCIDRPGVVTAARPQVPFGNITIGACIDRLGVVTAGIGSPEDVAVGIDRLLNVAIGTARPQDALIGIDRPENIAVVIARPDGVTSCYDA